MEVALETIKSEYLGMESRIRDFLVFNQRCKIDNSERMSVYNKVYSLITSSDQEGQWLSKNNELYEFYVERHRKFMDIWIDKTSQLNGLPFLEMFNSAWEKLKIFTKFCQTIFLKLDSFSVAYKNLTLVQKILHLQREWLKSANDKIKRALLDEFKKERDHDNCSKDLIKSIFRMYFEVDYEKESKLNMVNKQLEFSYNGDPKDQIVTTFQYNILDSLIQETADYYGRKLEEWIVMPVPDFLDVANSYLKEEDLRIQQYYNEFRQKVWKTVTDYVIVKHSATITKNEKSGLFQLLVSENLKYVKILYDFLTGANVEMHNFTAYVLNYIKHKISEFKKEFSDEGENADEIKFIEKLNNFRKTIMEICNNCYQGNKQIIGSVRLELQSEFSRVEDFPKLLATQIDDFIVKNGKNQESDEVQEQITNIFEMVNLTAERVSLLFYYEQTLKGRLLSVNNYYESMENEFLKRITQIMGEQQITKIKGMIQDMINSKKTNGDFQNFIKKRQNKYEAIKEIEIEISLLTKSKWPSDVFEIDICAAPEAIQNIESAFNDFYQSEATGTGKKIDWLYGEGSIEIIGKFKEGKKNFLVSVPQYSVLNCLQNANSEMKLSVADIKQRVNFSKKWLGAIFQPLFKQKVLKREKDKKEKLKDEELVWINTKFSSKNRKINLIDKKTLKGRDSKEDAKKIDDNKKISIEAATVRIMKSKKVAKFNELATDVRKILQDFFQPPDGMLRLIIEDLIKREYLERDDDDMNLFRYKA